MTEDVTYVLAYGSVLFALAGLAALTCNLLALSIASLAGDRTSNEIAADAVMIDEPNVLVQLPVYNEPNVVLRVLAAVAALDWPAERLQIQLLDDSSIDNAAVAATAIARLRQAGIAITHVRRPSRRGFKAGALAYGMTLDGSDFIAIFDADFVPPRDFLRRAMASLLRDDRVAFVQARWEHLNPVENVLTEAQAAMIDAHFAVEQNVRHRLGLVLPFNGTCGVWRRAAIEAAGGWSAATLCEDLDLAIRARLAGWRGVFISALTVPGELPTSLAAWRAQQFRWSKGFLQVACRSLPVVWRSDLPLRAKLALTLQTCQPACFPFSVLSLLGTVTLVADTGANVHVLSLAGGLVAAAGIAVSALILGLGRAALRRGNWRRFPWIIGLVLVLNAGLVVSNTRAVLEALVGIPSAFVRTAKRGSGPRAIAAEPGRADGLVELCAAASLGAALALAVGWLSPLLSLSIIGLLIMGGGLVRERLARTAEAAPLRRLTRD
jgi:cellulose synthase/poly-beta-1,6-N-acetylglucosamine synthase-like glycosyltransferase